MKRTAAAVVVVLVALVFFATSSTPAGAQTEPSPTFIDQPRIRR